ncbi:MAG: hypothetical protein EOM77_06155, partial [Bacteroidia bacterium]|nr:hypothetical protein [Bacteroidia bacterium]
RNAAKSIIENPDSVAFLLRSHGAILLGKSMEEAFNRAQVLEEVAVKEISRITSTNNYDELRTKYLNNYPLSKEHLIPAYGHSVRHNGTFALSINGKTQDYKMDDATLTGIAKVHQDIYRLGHIKCIDHDVMPDVLAVSRIGKKMRPYIDDVAQIIGVDIPVATLDDIDETIKMHNAVLLHDAGALCVGKDEEDVTAIKMILDKQCRSHILVTISGQGKPLGKIDTWLQRLVYVHKYSKLKNKGK